MATRQTNIPVPITAISAEDSSIVYHFKSIRDGITFLNQQNKTAKDIDYRNSINRKLNTGHPLHGYIWSSAQVAAPEPAIIPAPQAPQPLPAGLVDALVAEHGGRVIAEMRPSDGFINATKMCKSGGKRWRNYYQNQQTTSYIDELSCKTGIPVSDLVQSEHGGASPGTWVHHQVAIHLAMWISPAFAVAVTQLVARYLSGQVTTEESQQAAIETAETIRYFTNDSTRATITSAGYNTQVLGDQVYFGIPGSRLVFEKDLGENGIGIKFGTTRKGNEKKRYQDHMNEYGGFKFLDCIQCNDPEAIERKIKDSSYIMNHLITGKVESKRYRDTELLYVRDQEDYNSIVQQVKRFIDEMNDATPNNIEIALAEEKTKQEHEKTLQAEFNYKSESEKTKQLELQLRLWQLQHPIVQP